MSPPPSTGGGTQTPPPAPTPPAPVPTVPTLGVSRILCFGDSLTEGFIAVAPRMLLATRPESYPSRLLVLLSQRYTAQQFVVENAGLSGEWALDGQFRIVEVVKAAKPEVVVLMEGINDLIALGESGQGDALDAIENMLRDARGLGARVVLASLPPQRPGGLGGTVAPLLPEFNAALRRMAERQRELFVDVNAAFGGDLSLLSADGLHPTAAGYERIAQAVFDVLRANFEQSSRTSATSPPSSAAGR